MKTILVVTLIAFCLSQTLKIGPDTPSTPLPVAPAGIPAGPAPTSAPAQVCDMTAKLDCVRKRSNLSEDCNVASHCSSATDDSVEEVVKGERCWVEGRQRCVLNQFDPTGSKDCYGAVACMCNKACVHECETNTATPFIQCASQKCMCDLSLEQAKKL